MTTNKMLRRFAYKFSLIAISCLVSGRNGVAANPDTTEPPVANSSTMFIMQTDTATSKLPSTLGSADPDSRRIVEQLNSFLGELERLSNGKTAFAASDIPRGMESPSLRLVIPSGNLKGDGSGFIFGGVTKSIGKWTVVTPQKAQGLKTKMSRPSQLQKQRLEMAQSVIARYPMRFLFVPPEYFTSTLEQALPQLPRKFGGMPTTVLTRGIQWAALGFNPSTWEMAGTIQSETAEDAQALHEVLPELLERAAALAPVESQPFASRLMMSVVKEARTKVEGNQIVLSFPNMGREVFEKVLAESAKKTPSPIRRMSTVKKLQMIQLAILNYESAFGCFPPAKKFRNDNGQYGLSWRVHILPFFGEESTTKLYEQFHLDEAWNSPHNKQFVDKLPDIYQLASNPLFDKRSDDEQKGRTVFLAPQGKGTVFGQDKVLRFRDVADGSNHTLSVVVVKSRLAQTWTAPDDYRYDPENPASGLAFDQSGKGSGVAFDGACHELKKSWPAETFLHLFQRDDGHPVELK